MDRTTTTPWQHDHSFGLDRRQAGERRTLAVALLAAATMVVEIIGGIAFGSMALLATGLHMALHVIVLGVAVLMYVYARRRAGDPCFAFGTGKISALGGYTSALLLGAFVLYMAWESVERLIAPVAVDFNEAILFAVLGLVVNGVSAAILGGHSHDANGVHHHDHNLRGAYLHVVSDVLTAVLAIAALAIGKYTGAVWLDPAVGLAAAVLIARWSWGLMRDSGHVLLDRQAPAGIRDAVRSALEGFRDTRVADLHVWSIGPGLYAAELAVVSHDPAAPAAYKQRLSGLGLAHISIEIHRCRSETPVAVSQ